MDADDAAVFGKLFVRVEVNGVFAVVWEAEGAHGAGFRIEFFFRGGELWV